MRYKAFYVFLIAFLVVFMFLVLSHEKSDLCFEDKCISIEVKDTPQERALGLMYRENISWDEGMLFIFEKPDTYTFWMKNMKMPIDMIFINEDKEIVTMHKYVPPCQEEPCPLYAPDSPVLYVVETRAGFSDKYGLNIGEKADFSS